MLDVIGTQEEMGKGVGTDAVKNTFVRLYGLERCEELVQSYTKYAIDALSVFPDSLTAFAAAAVFSQGMILTSFNARRKSLHCDMACECE